MKKELAIISLLIAISLSLSQVSASVPLPDNSGLTTCDTIEYYDRYSNYPDCIPPHYNAHPPRQQIANGVVPEDVLCWGDLILVIKQNGLTSACVKPQTAQKLVGWGWAASNEGFKLSGKESTRILSEEDVRNILRDLEVINQQPANQLIDPDVYPKIVGIYEKNNWPLKEVYFCADICPELGYVTLIYANSPSKEDCRRIGGVYTEIDDPTFSIRSCKPNVKIEN